MKTIIVFLLLTLVSCSYGNAQTMLRKKHFNLKNGVAIHGYDPVAYLIQNKAIEGKAEISYIVEGVCYHFATDANRKVFMKDPAKYEPQYGGWCAYAIGENHKKIDIDPETFKIINGKVYFFYNSWG